MKIKYALISFCIVGYSTILELVRCLVFPFLKRISDRKGWDLAARQRFPYSIKDHRNRAVVWVHAASLGEAKLLHKFLEILEQRHPEDLYLVTATTRNGVQYLQERPTNTICATGFLPIDTIPLIKGVIEHFRVSRVWLLETELWPSMLWTCKRKGIPVGIVNARMEEKSFVNYRRFKGVLQYLFECFNVVLAQKRDIRRTLYTTGCQDQEYSYRGEFKEPHNDKTPAQKRVAGAQKGAQPQ